MERWDDDHRVVRANPGFSVAEPVYMGDGIEGFRYAPVIAWAIPMKVHRLHGEGEKNRYSYTVIPITVDGTSEQEQLLIRDPDGQFTCDGGHWAKNEADAVEEYLEWLQEHRRKYREGLAKDKAEAADAA